MEFKTENNKIICAYVYKDTIKRVYDCIRTPEVFNQTLTCAENIKVENGKFYSEIGTTLEFWWKDTFYVLFEVVESFDSDTYKSYKLYTKRVEPFNMKYSVTFHFYWNSIQNLTLFVHEMSFDSPNALKVIDVNHNKKEKLEMFQTMERILMEKTEDLYQYESIMIRKNIEEVWKVITDWNIFVKLVPTIAERVTYEGDKSTLGSKIHLEDTKKNIEYSLKIKEMDSKEECRKNCVFECYKGKPACPLQDLHFNLVMMNKDETFLSFKHVFKQPVKFELINSISQNKIQILTGLKKRIEQN